MDILIVDSSIHIVERLEEALVETEGISNVLTAVSAEGAWQLFEEYQPSVVLLDIHLPLNGAFPLLLKMKMKNADAIVIALSSQFSNFLENGFQSSGADYFLDKYHDYEKIPSIVNAISMNKKTAPLNKRVTCTVSIP